MGGIRGLEVSEVKRTGTCNMDRHWGFMGFEGLSMR